MRSDKEDKEENRDSNGILKGKGHDGNGKGLKNTEQQASDHRPQCIAQAAENGDGKTLDSQTGTDIVLRVGDRRHHRPGQSADSGTEDKGKSHHVSGVDAAKNSGRAIGGAGPHLPPDRGCLKKDVKTKNHEAAGANDPQHLR